MNEPGASRECRLRACLVAAFAPAELVISDDGNRHVGHAGAAGGHGHYKVRIVAEAFRGLAPLARHRLVYEAVGDLMKSDIHALAIDASAPQENVVGSAGKG